MVRMNYLCILKKKKLFDGNLDFHENVVRNLQLEEIF